ncbi:MAG: ATP-binding cassette domain-containing protein [Succinatimonas hippei]|nr:ATP-binding cassette domain-containing protein [Succinatimonas hippei]
MTGNASSIIKFENVTKTFIVKGQKVEALKDVNLEIKKGQIYGIIGFSGAGKSTLMRMVNALETPSSGKVYVNGEDVETLKHKGLRNLRKNIGMIFQQFNLLESKTVFDNIAIPLVLNHTPKKAIEKRVKDLLAFVGLEDRATAFPAQLSGGQKQRVGIARALATEPEILLCDEATSALDPDTTDSILKLLERVNQELNVTILFVTHMINVITRLCDGVAVMEHGRVVEYGSVLDVFSNPKAEITKRFVSSVIPNRIPDSIVQKLHDSKGPYKLICFRLQAKAATDNMIWQIDTGFKVVTNVMFASVTELQGVVLSVIVLKIEGDNDEIQKVQKYLDDHNVEWEEVHV